MKRMIYIGHAYHRKTQSVSFILELFRQKYDITFLSAEVVRKPGGELEQVITENLHMLSGQHFDLLVCLQVMPSIQNLKKYISFDHAVFFPMADFYYLAPEDVRQPIWREYRDFQIISFSRKVHEELKAYGYSSHCFQYFPEPPAQWETGDSHAAFFWQRITTVNVLVFQKLMRNYPLTELHLHRALDPGEQYVPLPYPLQGDMRIFHSSWFEHKEDMLRDLDRCGIYFASRHCEGIGLSYLEAMARGRCVIAPDETTFNEYIIPGKTGFLYPDQSGAQLKPLEISGEQVRQIQQNTRQYMQDGYREWCGKRNSILTLVETAPELDTARQKRLEPVWKKTETVFADNARTGSIQIPKNSILQKIRKWLRMQKMDSAEYQIIGTRRLLGIPVYTKVERTDRKMIYIFLLGLPLLTIEFRPQE